MALSASSSPAPATTPLQVHYGLQLTWEQLWELQHAAARQLDRLSQAELVDASGLQALWDGYQALRQTLGQNSLSGAERRRLAAVTRCLHTARSPVPALVRAAG